MNIGAYKNAIPTQAGNRNTVIDMDPGLRRSDKNTGVQDAHVLACRDRRARWRGRLVAACSMVFVTTVSAGTDCPGNMMGTDTDVNLSNLPSGFYSSGDVVNCLATGSIKLGPAVTFPANAVFNMVSPQVSINDNFSVASGSRLRIVTHTGELNDTGIVDYGDDVSNSLTMPPANYPGQDARYGRDYQWNDGSDGHAGFSYTKLDSQGNDLPAAASSWTCVRDNVSGLVWEVKDDVFNSLRNKDNTYSWYNPDDSSNGGSAGTPDGGACNGSACDTRSYREAINAQGLCGASDWRLPTVAELAGIVNLVRYHSAVDSGYFPFTMAQRYWTATPSSVGSPWADYVEFDDGRTDAVLKEQSYRVRLVRGSR